MDVTIFLMKIKYKWVMLLSSELSTLLHFANVMLKVKKTNRAVNKSNRLQSAQTFLILYRIINTLLIILLLYRRSS